MQVKDIAENSQKLRFGLIGEGLVLAGVTDILEKRGHEITIVYLNNFKQKAFFQQHGIPVYWGEKKPKEVLTETPIDILLSVNNEYILKRDLIEYPHIMAINYHNSLLPAYAGLRASAWAIHNGEKEHGITWHRLSKGIDTGEIITQKIVTIDKGETAARLNEKCTLAALEMLHDVLDKLEKYGADIPTVEQDFTKRSYYSRKNVLLRGGIIDWHTSASEIASFVASTIWESNDNDFGITKVLLPSGEVIAISEAKVLTKENKGAPGIILSNNQDEIHVTALMGVIALKQYSHSSIQWPKVGTQLPHLTDEQIELLSNSYRDALLNEVAWYPAFKHLARTKEDKKNGFDRRYGEISITSIDEAHSSIIGRCLDAIHKLIRVDIIVAVEVSHPPEYFPLNALSSNWLPLLVSGNKRGKELLTDLEKQPVLLRDIFLRLPNLSSCEEWERGQSVYLLQKESKMELSRLPNGAIAIQSTESGDITLHYRGPHGHALAKAIYTFISHSSDAGTEAQREERVLDLFAKQVEKHPETISIKEPGRSVTYDELDRESNRICNFLVSNGVKKEEIVATLLPASIDYITTIFGISKAGGSFLPLDIDAPMLRLNYQLADAQPRFIVTTSEYQNLLTAWEGSVLLLDDSGIEESSDERTHPHHPVLLTNRMYLIYTSGSTGQPKAVEIEYGALGNLISFYHNHLKFSQKDRISMLSHVTFDASISEIWPMLCAGATVVIPPKNILLNLDAFTTWLRDEKITTSYIPTAIANVMLKNAWIDIPSLKLLSTGGDALYTRPHADLPFPIYNGYGPTENTVDSTWSIIGSEDTGRPPPIGKPLANVFAYILNEQLHPVDEGISGELYLGGAQVARGYLNKPELTKANFLPDPFTDIPGGRMYRTGDKVFWNETGELEFIGRIDAQIQIYGHRVELGEINETIMAHPLVSQSYCVEYVKSGVIAGVIAHVALKPEVSVSQEDLKNYLAEHLPNYMIPREIIYYAKLPRNAGGKVDRKALLQQQVEPIKEALSPSFSADNHDEKIKELWYSLLPIYTPNNDEKTFWDLGGDSLAAVELFLGIQKITGYSLAVSSFLADPRLASLLDEFKTPPLSWPEAGDAFPKTSVLIPIQTHGEKKPLYCIPGVGGNPIAFRHFQQNMAEDQPVYYLRARGFEPDEKIERSTQSIAADYIKEIKKKQPHDPYHLLGMSCGGLIVYEMALQLSSQGDKVGFVGLLDTLLAEREEMKASKFRQFFILIRKHTQILSSGGHQGLRSYIEYYRKLVEFKIDNRHESNKRKEMLEEYGGAGKLHRQIEQANTDACLSYQAKPYSGKVVLFSSTRQAKFEGNNPDHGWSEFVTGELIIHKLDCYHGSILFEPFITQVTEITSSYLDRAYQIPFHD
ncbi:MAG: amino acid adenylation domain-containing protein [Anaerolineae bacterium]|jgi:amino acid adenylation domain-containing protein|nr:amino acid adenylation domain-containing protein [Anaerolineae bacterium]MBT7074813.1 amino acid adenylation domain-containing protein [Anaerolineae bacterium]